MGKMSINNGNDANGQKEKWSMFVVEAEKIDKLILQLHGNK